MEYKVFKTKFGWSSMYKDSFENNNVDYVRVFNPSATSSNMSEIKKVNILESEDIVVLKEDIENIQLIYKIFSKYQSKEIANLYCKNTYNNYSLDLVLDIVQEFNENEIDIIQGIVDKLDICLSELFNPLIYGMTGFLFVNVQSLSSKLCIKDSNINLRDEIKIILNDTEMRFIDGLLQRSIK